MKKLPIALVALALGGCATVPGASVPVARPAVHHKPIIKSHPVIKPTPVATPAPPAIAAPLVKPKWYDRFRHANGRLFH